MSSIPKTVRKKEDLLGEPIPPLTMLYDTVQYDSDQLNVRARYLFGSSIVIMLDMPVANGMLQFLDRAFPDALNMN